MRVLSRPVVSLVLVGLAACPRATGDVSDAPDASIPTPDPVADPHAASASRRATAAGEADAGASAARTAETQDAIAAMWGVLRGESDDLDGAEDALERWLAAADDTSQASRAIAVGRFYNVRALRGDASKAARQAEVYALVLGDLKTPEMDATTFRAWCFAQLGALLAQRADGRMLAAMATVKRVEDALAARIAADPDDVETHALAGNFAAFFAGNVPFDKRTRTKRAASHLTIVHERWAEMRSEGRDPDHCPNSRSTYAFALAEARLALGDKDGARTVYATLRAPETSTPLREQLAAIASDRMSRLDELAGDVELMPPWPSDADNCVVCHGTRAVSLSSLHRPPATDR